MSRVLVIADPHIPVPPTQYGGTERIAGILCDGLVGAGHIVDLIAAPGSRNYGGHLFTHVAPTHRKLSRAVRKVWFQQLSLRAARPADVVVSFGRIDYLWALLRSDKPLVIVFQNPAAQEETDVVRQQRSTAVRFVGISNTQMAGLQPADRIDVIPNAADIAKLPFQPVADAPPYFAFLGRLTANKGVHLAITAAHAAGVHLKIAGNVSQEAGGPAYFASEVKPHVGGAVEYVGPVNDDQKANLLGGATGLLFPIQWREPFGIVLAEALACGCPVIGWRNGSVPEVIRHGETGFVVDSVDAMVAAIRDIGRIDRAVCRRDAETRFSPRSLVDGYLQVIERLLAETARVGKRG